MSEKHWYRRFPGRSQRTTSPFLRLGTAKRFSKAILTSGPSTDFNTNPPLSLSNLYFSTITCAVVRLFAHTFPQTTRTCWPDLLPRGEMRTNSAFQHIPLVIFQFHGQIFSETHVVLPFSVWDSASLCLSPTRAGNPSSPV